MAYSADSIERFISSVDLTEEIQDGIRQRTKAVATNVEGLFSAEQIEKVLGNPILLETFNNLWNKGELVG